MKGRSPTKFDLYKMKRALALVTSYDDGIESNDFDLFRQILEETPEEMVETLAQLAWLFLKNPEAATKEERSAILDWYGKKLALAEAVAE